MEDTTFCPGGPTYLSILKSNSDNNAVTMLQKEFIASVLNGLKGASASQALTDMKTQSMLLFCCR